MNTRSGLVGGVLGLAMCAGAASGQGLIVHAMTGQPVVGGLEGEVYSSFDGASSSGSRTIPRINNGHIVFRGASETEDFFFRRYMVGQPGRAVSRLTLSDIPVPDGHVVRHATSIAPAIRVSSDGELAVLIRFEGEGINTLSDEAFVSTAGSGVQIVLRESGAVSGYSGVVYQHGLSSHLAHDRKNWTYSSTGVLALDIRTRHESNNVFAFSAVVAADEIASQVATRAYGTGLPGSDYGIGILHQVMSQPLVTPSGVVAFQGGFDGYSGGSFFGVGVVSGSQNRIIVATNTPVDGQPGLTMTAGVGGGISLNDSGMVSVPVSLRYGSVSVGTAIARVSESSSSIVVRSGDPKPDRPGLFFTTADLSSAQTRISHDGTVAFADQSRLGVYIGTSITDLRLAFDPLSAVWPAGLGQPLVIPDTIGMNASNQLVAALTFPTSPATTAVAGWDPVAGNILIAYTGQTIEVLPGVFRTIRTIDINGMDGVVSGGGEDGRPNSLDNAGRIVFTAHFTNNESAVLVATIPSPAAWSALTIVVVAGLRRSRTR